MKHYLFASLLCLVILAGIGAHAQTPRVDSLKTVLLGQKDSLSKLRTLLALCGQKESLPGDSIFGYATSAQRLARHLNDQPRLLLANYYVLLSLANQGKLDTVLAEDNRVLKTLSYDTQRDIFTKYYNQRTRIYIRRARYKEAQQAAYGLLQKAEKAGDPDGLVYGYNHIGWSYMEMEQLPAALEWFHKVEGVMNTAKPDINNSPLFCNMAAVLNDMGRYDSASYYIQRSIVCAEQGQSLAWLANAFAVQSDIFVNTGRIADAESSMTRAIAIRRQIGDPFYIVSDMGALAFLYSRNKKTAEGIRISKDGIAIARQFHFKPKELYLSEGLAENYHAAGDYKNYAATLKTIMGLKDSLYKDNSQQALADMQAKYETQRKENIIIEQKFKLSRQRYISYAIAALLIFSLAFGVVFFEIRRHRQRLRDQQLILENQRRQQEAVEHTREEERRRILADLHDELGSGLSSIRIMSDLMSNAHSLSPEFVAKNARRISEISRDTTQGMNTIIWALNNDNDTVHNLYEYIGRFGESLFENSRIQFHISLTPGLPDFTLSGAHRKNLFLCVKESLHNVLKHSGATTVHVDVYYESGRLCITVKDNGNGTPETLPAKWGNGIKNMNRRMEEIGGNTWYTAGNGLTVHFAAPLE